MKDRKTSPKLEYLAETARELFFARGIKRISVEEICSKAGVSRMTFYRCFSNKADIAKRIIKSIYDETREKVNDILDRDLPFEKKLRKILKMKIELGNKFSQKFMNELILGSAPEIKEYIEKENARSLEDLKKIFLQAKKDGEVRRNIKVEFIVYMMNVMRRVLNDEDLQKMYPDFGSLMTETFNFFYYGVLSKK